MPVQMVARTTWMANHWDLRLRGKVIALPTVPKINDDGEHCAGVQHDEEHGHFGTRRIQPHEFFRHDDVRRTGNGQQFARALNQGQNQDLKIAQHDYEVCVEISKITITTAVAADENLFFPSPKGFILCGALFDFELSQYGMPADVDFVPLAFDAAKFALTHLAQITQRWRMADD